MLSGVSMRKAHCFKQTRTGKYNARGGIYFLGRLSRCVEREGEIMKPWDVKVSAASGNMEAIVPFPEDYTEAIKQAQDSTLKAIDDGAKLIEVEFPTASLSSVAGDAEGANEMTYSLQFLRRYARAFQSKATKTRIFFPDYNELMVAKNGKSKDPNAGSWDIEAVWSGKTEYNLDYLTKPSGLLDIGIDLSGFNPLDHIQETDEILIAAYPSK